MPQFSQIMMLRPLDNMFRTEKTMFRPPSDVSQAAGILEAKICWSQEGRAILRHSWRSQVHCTTNSKQRLSLKSETAPESQVRNSACVSIQKQRLSQVRNSYESPVRYQHWLTQSFENLRQQYIHFNPEIASHLIWLIYSFLYLLSHLVSLINF